MLYIFDMGGVVTTTANLFGRVCEVLGMQKDEFLAACGCTGNGAGYATPSSRPYVPGDIDLLTMCSDGVISSREFWRIFSQRSGVAVKTDWWQWLFHPVLNQGTVDVIRELRGKGQRVVCGTNTIDSHYRNHVERGDYAWFDQTYASCLMGVSKPDPEFWRLILTAEQADPHDVTFIDDRAENCSAATALGIRAIQFTTADDLRQSLGL